MMISLGDYSLSLPCLPLLGPYVHVSTTNTALSAEYMKQYIYKRKRGFDEIRKESKATSIKLEVIRSLLNQFFIVLS